MTKTTEPDPELVPGPFVLTPLEALAMESPIDGEGEGDTLKGAVARALRTIGPLELPPAEPQPDAPLDFELLPDYWDQRRALQGKPDKSRCAAELRLALRQHADALAAFSAKLLALEKSFDEIRVFLRPARDQ